MICVHEKVFKAESNVLLVFSTVYFFFFGKSSFINRYIKNLNIQTVQSSSVNLLK